MWVALVGYGFGSFRRSITCDGLVVVVFVCVCVCVCFVCFCVCVFCRIGVAAGPLVLRPVLNSEVIKHGA